MVSVTIMHPEAPPPVAETVPRAKQQQHNNKQHTTNQLHIQAQTQHLSTTQNTHTHTLNKTIAQQTSSRAPGPPGRPRDRARPAPGHGPLRHGPARREIVKVREVIVIVAITAILIAMPIILMMIIMHGPLRHGRPEGSSCFA